MTVCLIKIYKYVETKAFECFDFWSILLQIQYFSLLNFTSLHLYRLFHSDMAFYCSSLFGGPRKKRNGSTPNRQLRANQYTLAYTFSSTLKSLIAPYPVQIEALTLFASDHLQVRSVRGCVCTRQHVEHARKKSECASIDWCSLFTSHPQERNKAWREGERIFSCTAWKCERAHKV